MLHAYLEESTYGLFHPSTANFQSSGTYVPNRIPSNRNQLDIRESFFIWRTGNNFFEIYEHSPNKLRDNCLRLSIPNKILFKNLEFIELKENTKHYISILWLSTDLTLFRLRIHHPVCLFFLFIL